MTSKKTPLRHKIIPYVFPITEKFAKPIANKLALKLFFQPPRKDYTEQDVEFLSKAKQFQLNVDDQKIYAYSWGEGPKVLLVHGWGGYATQFSQIILQLVKSGFEVITFDAPGHGQSTGKHSDILLFEKSIHEVNAILGNVDFIIGHSLGGVASLLAIKNGLKINKFISISAPSISEDILYQFRKQINATPKIDSVIENHILDKYNIPFDQVSAETIAKEIKEEVPTLLIHCEDDNRVPLKHMVVLKKNIPQSEYYTSSGKGHIRILKCINVSLKIEDFLKN